jgi:ribosome modulation factor
MKKILAIFCIILLILTYSCIKPESKPTPNKPVPIEILKLGVVNCDQCKGDGLIDIEDDSEFCPKCNGFGKLQVLSDGTIKPCGKDFIRGYKDAKAGIPIEDCPFLLKIRSTEWIAGWRAATESV